MVNLSGKGRMVLMVKLLTTVTFTSTTDASGLPAQSGGIDTYTINLL